VSEAREIWDERSRLPLDSRRLPAVARRSSDT
jgi:hypothetical protein